MNSVNSKSLKRIQRKGVKMKINIKKLTETAKIPTKQHEGDAGYDLYADMTKLLGTIK